MRVLYAIALSLSMAGFVGVALSCVFYLSTMAYWFFGIQLVSSLYVGYLEIIWRRPLE